MRRENERLEIITPPRKPYMATVSSMMLTHNAAIANASASVISICWALNGPALVRTRAQLVDQYLSCCK